MPKEESNETTPDDEAVADQVSEGAEEEAAPEEGAESEAPADEEGDKEEDEDGDELPESVKKKLSKLRGEAASWRTQLREAQDALAKAKTPEDFEAVRNESATKVAALERELVLAKVPLPEDLAKRLSGNTFEELLADAKSLQKFAPATLPDNVGLSGGLDPTEEIEDEADLAKRAQRIRRSRNRF